MSYDWPDGYTAPEQPRTLRERIVWQWHRFMLWLALDAPFEWMNSLGLRVVLGPGRHKKHG